MKLFLCSLVAAVCFVSCKKSCQTPSITAIYIDRPATATDTSAVVTQYRKGSNFTVVTGTFNDLYASTSGPGFFTIYFPITTDGFVAYYYDWKITLLPSGKTYLVQDISHDNSKQSSDFSIGEVKQCVNSVHYTVNGNHGHDAPTYSNNGMPTGSLSFPYDP